MNLEAKLKEMGLELPEPPNPMASYVRAVKSGNLLFISGQIPFVKGVIKYKGKLGSHLTVEEGYEAARVCALNVLSIVKAEVGDLEKIERIVKLTGYVNSSSGFTDQPKVLNGGSELFSQLLGEKGKHARVAVGVNELPLDAAVELEVIVEVRD